MSDTSTSVAEEVGALGGRPVPAVPAVYKLKVLAQGGGRAELEAPSATTVGQLRETALGAIGIRPDPSVQWFVHYQGEQLNNDSATLAQVIGPHDPDKQVTMHLKKQPFAGTAVLDLPSLASGAAARPMGTVRFCCAGYNAQPPSVTLVRSDTWAETLAAWPNVPDGPGAIFRPNPNLAEAFICTPGTREWYGHGHTEFRGPEHWHLPVIAESIHFALNSTGYRGRYPG
jgi:hypothetical protein